MSISANTSSKPADVYFTDLRCSYGHNHYEKLLNLVRKAGIDTIDFDKKYVAIKLHFGEWGNLAYLRPQYARVLCDHIKERGGKPFVTDANTLYAGYRNNAVDHLVCADMNGYNSLVTGVPTIIADGLRGTDERAIPVKGGKYVKEARIASAIAEADIVISMNHFKGHMVAGFGGALKNIGMGCGSKRGKMEMHSAGTPAVNAKKCIGCGSCVRNCDNEGVRVVDKLAQITDSCVGCGHCLSFCPVGALYCKYDDAPANVSAKIAEYTWAALDGKPNFHINFVMQVSPECDCNAGHDTPLIPDLGMFASFDPVALDQACVDAANAAPRLSNNVLDDEIDKQTSADNTDVFKMVHPDVSWEAGLIRAEELGLGTRAYTLHTC